MKRNHLTKMTAVISTMLVLSMSAGLPVLAGSLILCTTEAEGELPPFEILAVEDSAAGSNADAGAGNTVGGAIEGAAEDIGNAVEDLLPGSDNPPADNAPSDAAGTSPDNTPAQDVTPDYRDEHAGNGNAEEGQAGGDENGMVGDGTGRDTTEPASGTSGTTTTPAEKDAAGSDAETTAQNDSGTNWTSLIIALLIAVALVVVIVALLPRKRTD